MQAYSHGILILGYFLYRHATLIIMYLSIRLASTTFIISLFDSCVEEDESEWSGFYQNALQAESPLTHFGI